MMGWYLILCGILLFWAVNFFSAAAALFSGSLARVFNSGQQGCKLFLGGKHFLGSNFIVGARLFLGCS